MADNKTYGVCENKALAEVYRKDEVYSKVEIDDKVIPISGGGTGATTVAAAQKNLELDENYIVLELTSHYNLSTSPAKIPFDGIKQNKGNLLSVSNNGVKVGAGVTKVKVSANVRLYPRTSSNASNTLTIFKNDTSIPQQYSGAPNVEGMLAFYSLADFIVDVKEGDVIYLYGRTSLASVGRIGQTSQFKVEAVR